MNDWIISVICVSAISIIIKLILPDGRSKNTVTFIISLIGILAIISPITKIDFNNVNLNFDFQNEIEVDKTFIEYVEDCRENYYLTMANTKLSEYLTINKANFVFDDSQSGNPLKKIEINFDDLVIKNNNEHINISSIIKESLSQQFIISKECIIIYGEND